jgi:hypothetical protein
MKRKVLGTVFAAVFLLLLVAITNAESELNRLRPIAQKKEMSEIILAYAKRQNYIIREGKREIYPDGIAFYFVIYRLNNNLKVPVLVELRDFRINDVSYLEITRRNGINDIEPNTVIYNERTFREDEYFGKVGLQKGTGALIEKVIICGSSIPDTGRINVDLKFGFDNKVEEFNYQFNVGDIEK